jgi:hypothetical protein
LHLSVGAFEAVALLPQRFPGQTATVCFLPALRNLGKDFVMRDADKFPISEAKVLAPATASLHVAHLPVQECGGGGSVLNEQTHPLFTSA